MSFHFTEEGGQFAEKQPQLNWNKWKYSKLHP